MRIPMIKDAPALLALLRLEPTKHAVCFVGDEYLAVCYCEDGDPHPQKIRRVVAQVATEGTAHQMLAAALAADNDKDLHYKEWLAFPVRYGPYCSTWVLPENPNADDAIE